MTSGTGRVTVAIFDPTCRLCRGFAAMLRRRVPVDRLDVVPCGSPIQHKLAPEVSDATCRAAFTIVLAGGRVVTGGEAATAAIALAPELERHRWMIASAPTTWLARMAYAVVSRLRGRSGCSGCGSKSSGRPKRVSRHEGSGDTGETPSPSAPLSPRPSP